MGRTNNEVMMAADESPGRLRSTFVNSHRFAWIHLGCALVAAAIWYVSGGRAGPWPLLIAGAPWAARVISGHSPVVRTRFDPFLLMFVTGAAIGVWAAYDQPAAIEKFWLILGGVILFYALAGQRAANIWPLLIGVAFFGGGVGLYFLLTHNWNEAPAKIDSFNQLGLQLMNLRPAIFQNLHQLHPNVAGGIIALLFPCAIAAMVRMLRERRFLLALLVAAALGIMILALALTTSRGAWIALFGGLVAWLIWIGAKDMSNSLFLSRRKTLGLAGLVLSGIALSVVLLSPRGLSGFFDRLPGPASAGSRMQLAQDAFDLTGDYWLTGAGLNSFDGLYSQYIQVIPFHAVIHSHNLFLNIIIEEGILGIASIGAILALSFWWLSDPKLSGYRRSIHGFSLLAGATFAMLVVLCLHGLVDDVLFGSRGILLLWFPAGITAMLFPRRQGLREWVKAAESPRLIFLGVVTVITALLLVTFRSSLLSSWYATLGAIEMDRVELANYPSGEWSDGSEAVDLGVAVSQFNRALLYDQDNRTAWHRLGLVAMLDRDFETAADSLYHAYLLDSQHRGIRKSLAYARLWAGDLEQAMPLLQEVPDVELELANYVEWWKSQGRPDLSERAEAARNILTNLNSH